MHVFTVLYMVNHFEAYFVAYCAYFTAEIHQFKKKHTLGQIENLVFVIMSTRENIRLIARTSFCQNEVSGFAVQHIDDCFSGSTSVV